MKTQILRCFACVALVLSGFGQANRAARAQGAAPAPQTSPSAPPPGSPIPPAGSPVTGELDLLEILEGRLRRIVRDARLSIVQIEGRPHVLKLADPRGAKSDGQQKVPFGEQGRPQGSGGGGNSNSKEDLETGGIAAAILRANNLLRVPVSGSGFLIPGGFVVTTSELLERMRDPVVMFSDGKRARVEWTNFDTYSNVAILKVGDVASTAGLRWGDSERVAAGNFAVTMGTMGGFTHSASIGFIAGTGRTGQSGNILYENLIQFQGMIGGGSGGPLMNLRGEVVGMIAAVPSRNAQMRITGQSVPNSETPASIFFFDNVTSNVAFAIPANELKPIVARLTRRENLNAQPGWLGVHLSRPDENEGEPQPPKLLGIFVGGPADRAGAMLDDLVLAVDGHPVQTAEELRAFLKQCRAGQKMTLKVRRGAQVHTLNVLIDARPDEKVIQRIPVRRRSPQSGYLPLEMRPVSPFLLMT